MADPRADPTPDRPSPEWLGRLAHDLRNPITPMRSAVQLLQLGQLPPELAPDLLRTLDRQIDYLLHLIDDVADLVKIERGEFQLRLATCDLGQVAASAVDRHARKGGQGGRAAPAFVVDAPPAPVWVHADEVRLRQLVELLLPLVGGVGDAPAPAIVRVGQADGAATLRFADGDRPLAADPRLDYLAGGTMPTDPAALTFAQLVGRRIVDDHGARLALDPDGTALVLHVPLAKPGADV
jgi:nitrogen fixation/metabolism regulation signal transduction histidine kinase